MFVAHPLFALGKRVDGSLLPSSVQKKWWGKGSGPERARPRLETKHTWAPGTMIPDSRNLVSDLSLAGPT